MFLIARGILFYRKLVKLFFCEGGFCRLRCATLGAPQSFCGSLGLCGSPVRPTSAAHRCAPPVRPTSAGKAHEHHRARAAHEHVEPQRDCGARVPGMGLN
jgi:hypothetical protein